MNISLFYVDFVNYNDEVLEKVIVIKNFNVILNGQQMIISFWQNGKFLLINKMLNCCFQS